MRYEKLSLDEIKNCLLYQFKSESELIVEIDKISKSFTKSREEIDTYINNEKPVSAYVQFYFLTNYPKLNAVFDKINFDFQKLKEFEVIDIGSGPGTFCFSLLQMNPELKIYAIEKSEVMIEQGQKILDHFFDNHQVEFSSSISLIPSKKKKRLVIFGHSANEIGAQNSLGLIEKLEADEVLFIEPGTKDYFRNTALEIRKELLLKDFSIKYPCPSTNNCPMEKEDDWCHQYLYLSHHPTVERLCQLVSKNRRHLPQTIHYYSKDKHINGKPRLIQKVSSNKAGFKWKVCHEDNELAVYEALSRNFTKSERKETEKFLAGDTMQIKERKEIDDNHFRVLLNNY